ncbi:hypothetical protein [Nostoc sp.]|uniref:hypothetical protein n=1 Tax=Nostoc sp. TaxID=1180 RepID=UPI002FF5F445
MGFVCVDAVSNRPFRVKLTRTVFVLISNAQCPMPNAQCPMPNAQCPMPNAQCPISNLLPK